MSSSCCQVSIIILTFNQVEYVEKAIVSALNQKTNANYEVIVADDCSTDGTWELLQSLALKYNFKAINTDTNMRIVGNLMNAFNASKGKYIFLMGGDDLSHEDRVSTIVNLFEKESDIYSVYSDTADITANGQAINQNISSGKKYFLRNSNMNTLSFLENDLGVLGCSAAYRRDVFELYGALSASLPSEDKILTLRSLLLGKVLYTPKKLVSYRLGVGVSNNIGIKTRLNYIKLLHGKLKTYEGYLKDCCSRDLSSTEVIIINKMVDFFSLSIALMNNFNLHKLIKALFVSKVTSKEKLRLLYYLFKR